MLLKKVGRQIAAYFWLRHLLTASVITNINIMFFKIYVRMLQMYKYTQRMSNSVSVK